MPPRAQRTTQRPSNKPLPGRLNIVLSRDKDLSLPEGVLLYNDINAAIERVQREDTEEAFVIGGGKIFEQAMPTADRMYVTRVNTVIADADAFFPPVDHTHWKLVWQEKHSADDRHAFDYTFEQYERVEL